MKDEVRENRCYKFADFRLETETQTISRENNEIHLPKRQFQILRYLLENRGRVVSRDELLDKFWEGHEVYDDALRKAVTAIRQALDDTAKPSRFIETRRGSGFRFIGVVEEVQSSEFKVQNLKAEIEAEIIDNAPEGGQNADPPKVSFWRSRIILISIFAIISIFLTNFAVSIYSPRDETDKRGRIPKISAIAVLPLRNLTGDATNDYLSDGLSEGLINEFSRHGELKVISRGSSFAFKDKNLEPREIAEKLKVEAILEGSLRKFGDEMRIEVNLVDVKNGTVLWTNDTANASMRNSFITQNKIACDVLARIEAGNCAKIETAQNIDAEAYRLYLKGIFIRNDLTFESMTNAVNLFEQALQIAPNFAGAHEGIATTYIVMESNSLVSPGSVIKKAEFHANEALKLNENSVDALLVLSETKTADNYDLELRENLLRQAVEKSPNFGRARMWLANVLTTRGKFAEAESELLKLRESDPLSFGVLFTLCELYLYWRKPDETIKTINLMRELDTSEAMYNRLLATAYLRKSDFAQAKIIIDKDPDSYRSLLIIWLTKTGKTGEARTELKKLEAAETGTTAPFVIGYLYAQLGEKDTAFAWLEKSYEMRQSDLVSLKVEPALDNLRDDARYQKLLARVGLAD